MELKEVATFQERLYELLKSESYTTAAEKLGVSKGTISHWISGFREPRLPMVERIAHLYNVNVEWLMGYDYPKYKDTEDDLEEYLEELKNRSEMRMLFDASKGATKEQIEAIVHLIENMK